MLDSGNELSIIWTFAYGVGYSLSLTFLVRKICQIKLKSTKEETSHSLMEVKSSRHLMCLEKDKPLYVCANALCRFQLRQPKALPQNRCSDYEKQLQYISKFCVILKRFYITNVFIWLNLPKIKKTHLVYVCGRNTWHFQRCYWYEFTAHFHDAIRARLLRCSWISENCLLSDCHFHGVRMSLAF